MQLDLSIDSNCRVFDSHLPENMYFSNVYFVSSKRPKIVMDQSSYEVQKELILDELQDASDDMEFNELNEVNGLNALSDNDATPNFMTAYIASSIEQKIMESSTFHCTECVSVFEENEKEESISTHLLQWKPCTSTMNICKTAERLFKLYDVKKSNSRYDFKVLYCMIFRSMNLDSLFPKSQFSCDIHHRYQFIK